MIYEFVYDIGSGNYADTHFPGGVTGFRVGEGGGFPHLTNDEILQLSEWLLSKIDREYAHQPRAGVCGFVVEAYDDSSTTQKPVKRAEYSVDRYRDGDKDVVKIVEKPQEKWIWEN